MQAGPSDWGAPAAIPRLHRITNKNQRRLLWIIHKFPGLNSQELAQALGVTRTAAVYHARRLLKDGYIMEEKQGPHKLHFPAAVPATRRKALALLRVESVRAVALAVYGRPRSTIKSLVDCTALNPRTVRRALQALRHNQLAHCEKNGRGQIIHLHPEVRLVLARWSNETQGAGPYPEHALNGQGWPPDLND